MSVRMRALALAARVSGGDAWSVEGVLARVAEAKTSTEPPTDMVERHDFSRRTVFGLDVLTVAPKNGRATRVVLYIHGGGYINGISPQHYALISRLVESGVRVDVPLYEIAPHGTAVEAYEFLVEVYRRLCEEVDARSVLIMGDSAGGALAVGLVQQVPAPACRGLKLIAPWLDAALDNPEIVAVERRAPWMPRAGLREAARMWAGPLALDDPRVSPLRGTLSGLPPIEIWCGTRDVFYPDVVAFTRRVREANGVVRLTECPGGIHLYPMLPTPEGKAATREIVESVVDPGSS